MTSINNSNSNIPWIRLLPWLILILFVSSKGIECYNVHREKEMFTELSRKQSFLIYRLIITPTLDYVHLDILNQENTITLIDKILHSPELEGNYRYKGIWKELNQCERKGLLLYAKAVIYYNLDQIVNHRYVLNQLFYTLSLSSCNMGGYIADGLHLNFPKSTSLARGNTHVFSTKIRDLPRSASFWRDKEQGRRNLYWNVSNQKTESFFSLGDKRQPQLEYIPDILSYQSSVRYITGIDQKRRYQEKFSKTQRQAISQAIEIGHYDSSGFNTVQIHELLEEHKNESLFKYIQKKKIAERFIPDSILYFFTTLSDSNTIKKYYRSWDLDQELSDLRYIFAKHDRKKEEPYSANSIEAYIVNDQLLEYVFRKSPNANFIYRNGFVRPTQLGKIQLSLKSNQTLLNYYVGDSSAYVFIIDDEYTIFVRLPTNKGELKELVSSFRTSISSYWINKNSSDHDYISNTNTYTKTAYKLYKKLIQPIEGWLENELIIVPDDALGYLPFECLLTTKPETSNAYRNHNYLLHEHIISYSFSASIWREMSLRTPILKSNQIIYLAAFAPNFSNTNLPNLEWNTKEAKAISSSSEGKVFTDFMVNLNNVQDMLYSARITHISTHAKSGVTGTESQLILNDTTSLYEKDIMQFQTNSDLVFLSACQTGVGILEEGEGVQSITSAFAYSGAKSIISSLWNINDKKSYDLVLKFYKQLSEGEMKHTALRKAKLHLINSGSHRDAHPYFWGSFILNGNISSLPL